jgi:hypothetical protein
MTRNATTRNNKIVFDYKPDEPGLGKGGTGVLSMDGKEVARNALPEWQHLVPTPVRREWRVLQSRSNAVRFREGVRLGNDRVSRL